MNPDIELACVIVEPGSGKVLALSGGRDYDKSEFNRAISSKRQVGSTIKPFLYCFLLPDKIAGLQGVPKT